MPAPIRLPALPAGPVQDGRGVHKQLFVPHGHSCMHLRALQGS